MFIASVHTVTDYFLCVVISCVNKEEGFLTSSMSEMLGFSDNKEDGK